MTVAQDYLAPRGLQQPLKEWGAAAVVSGVTAMFYQLLAQLGTAQMEWYNYLCPTSGPCTPSSLTRT